MKWFGRILSIYLLFLSAFPCGDKEECESAEIAAVLTLQDHSNHQDHEQCPPLCTCICCGHQVIKSAFNLQVALPEMRSVKQPAEHCFNLKEIYHAIWQPPQLS